MMENNLLKERLREQYRAERLALNPTIKTEYDRIIFERLLQNKTFQKTNSVLFYVSIDGEVDTHAALSAAWSLGKKVVVPKVCGKKLLLIEIAGWQDLCKGYKGILEPISDTEITFKPDLVIVPGLAFDRNGHRLGYGGGYYDRLLSALDCYTVGLCYEQMLVDNLPLEVHDIPVDCVITQQREIYTK